MSKNLKKKAVLMVVIEIVCLIILGGFLTVMQTRLSENNQAQSYSEKLKQMPEILASAAETSEQETVSYDEVFQAKASSIAYLAAKDGEFSYTDAKMKEMASVLEVTNALIIDKEGNVVAKAAKPQADFTYPRYNQLRTVFADGEVSEAFEVTVGDGERRYYGAKINDTLEAVIEQDPEELHRIQDDTSSWKSVLSKIHIGMDGYAFAVSSQDYTFLYHPDEALVGQDSLEKGMDVENLEDSFYGWMTVDGKRLYCGVTKIDSENAYIICAVPENEIVQSRNITVGIVLFVFFVVITIVIIYAILMLKDQEKNGREVWSDGKNSKIKYNKEIGHKISAISVAGLALILIVSFYMQTLFLLSMHSMSNNRRVGDVEETIERNNEEVKLTTEQYNKYYLNKGVTAAYILNDNQELWNREDLKELSQALGVEFVIVFDETGKAIATDSTYMGFQISDDPASQSYEFNRLLQGGKPIIQAAQPDEVSGEYHQYIGAGLADEEGNPTGFVQVSVVPDKLEKALAATKLSSVLEGIKVGVNGFAFAVDKEDKTFAYYPKERMTGKNALDYGMKEKQFRDGYCDYITIDGEKFYGSCLETETADIYVVIPENEMSGSRVPVALASTGVSLICLLLVCLLLSFSRKNEKKTAAGGADGENDGPMIDVVMPDGSVRKSEDVSSRWSVLSLKWDEKTPEQQIGSVIAGLLGIFAFFICAAVLFKEHFFDSNSIFLFVLNGKWERGVNVFAITGCIMIICVVSVAVMIIRKILKILSRTFGARGETVCRLISSFAKYVSVIAMMYYCFALFGVDTKTLLASAGILTLVIGLGAKELVSDILAGLFIIFEGEFQVGDIVTVGDWRGTVLEIGVRTTKIEDPGNNVKIISNSAVSGVINMTKRHSYAVCDIGIEYGESLERVENILAKELPNIKKHVPAIVDGPFYKGVSSLGDNSVNIKLVAQCLEANRIQVGRDLNREMKIMFDKYDINIPFPQVVINQPKEYEKATEFEKWQADQFNKSQKELTKGMAEESEQKS